MGGSSRRVDSCLRPACQTWLRWQGQMRTWKELVMQIALWRQVVTGARKACNGGAMPRTHQRRLLASIHDVSPAFEGQVDALYDRLSGLLGVRASPCWSCPISRTARRSREILLMQPSCAAGRGGSRDVPPRLVPSRRRAQARLHAEAHDGGRGRIRPAAQGRGAAAARRRAQDRRGRHRPARRGFHRPGVALFARCARSARRGRFRAGREPSQGLAADHRAHRRAQPSHHLGEPHAGPRQELADGRRRRPRRALGHWAMPASPCIPGDTTVPALLGQHRRDLPHLHADAQTARYADLLA